MTGNPELSDLIIEICTSLGHEYDDHHSLRRSLVYKPNFEELHFKISGFSKTNYYYVEVKTDKNQARFSVGKLPVFDFHDSDSIILFKATAMNMPLYVALEQLANNINFQLIPNKPDW